MNNLKDLKKTGKIIFIPLIAIALGVMIFSKEIILWITTYYGINTVALSITESFNVQLKLSLLISAISLLPLITFGLYQFLKPAYELKGWMFKIVLSEILALEGFVLGVTYFSKTIMNNLDMLSITAGYYSLNNILSFGIGIGFAIALCFQLILLIPLLNSHNIIDSKKLWKSSGIMLILAYFISAFITPPDITSTIMVMLPLSFSYSLGIGISRLNTHNLREKIENDRIE